MKAHRLLLACILALNLLALSPLLQCGYSGDDLFNTLAPGMQAEAGYGAWGQFGELVRMWAAHGRFYPLALYYVFLFSAVRSLWAYRLLQMALVALDLLLFARLVTSWTGSRGLGLLAALLPAALFQFRLDGDPVLAFHGMLQVVFAAVAGSLLCLDSYLLTGRRWLFGLSILFYLLGLLTYDVTYPFFLIHGALIGCRAAGPRPVAFVVKRLSPFVVLSAALLGLCVLLRVRHGVGLPGHSYGSADLYAQPLNLALWPVTWAKQTLAAFPLSHLALFLPAHEAVTASDLLGQCSAVVAVAALAGWALARRVLRDAGGAPPGLPATAATGLGPPSLFLLGALLTVLPGALMALVPVYQRRLQWGTCHVPVYLSYFGVATVLVAFAQLTGILCRSWRRLHAGLATAGAALFAATLAVNVAANGWMVGVVNRHFGGHDSRSLLQSALERGLFGPVPDGSCLVVADRPEYIIDSGYRFFFHTYAGRHLEVRPRGSYPDGGRAPQSPAQVYYLRYGAHTGAVGYAILGACDRLSATAEEVQSAASCRAYLYVQLPDPHQAFTVTGKWLQEGRAAGGDYFAFSGGQLRLLRLGRNWRLYQLPFSDRSADLATLAVDMDPGRWPRAAAVPH